MELPDFDFVEAARVRRAVVPVGDIRGDIAFQNDINVLLARLDAGNPPLQALGWVREAVAAPSASAPAVDRPFRIIRGGGLRARAETELEDQPAVARRA